MLATQTLPMDRPKTMAVTVNGTLPDGVTAKDLVLTLIASGQVIGMTPEDWFSMFLIGAPCSRMLVSSKATPPPRLDSCSAELMDRPMDSMLSSMRSRKQLTGSPRCFLPELRNVGVAGWNRPSMISSSTFSASDVSPAARVRATMATRSSKRSR